MISSELEIPEQSFWLTYKDKFLNPLMTLRDYNIKDKNEIQMKFKLRGGGFLVSNFSQSTISI